MHDGPRADERIDELVSSMTLREQIGQMTQVEFGSITPDEVAEWAIGSVLSGGGGNPGDGTARAWRDMVESYVNASRHSRLGVPILYGTDAVHGHNNVLGATIFPHHLGLGAAGDADLVRRIARASALETAATGARWTFAPCLAVPYDVRWGRTYEGFSQDPRVVAELGRAAVEGWHGDDLVADGVLACAKHYVGEGAAEWGTAGQHRHPWIDWWQGWGADWQIDQGDIRIGDDELRNVHLLPFRAAVEAGAVTVMACYASWHGRRIHADRYLLTDVLKGELGFEGFVVSDWMAVDQIDPDYPTAIERSIAAGLDMVMVPFDFRRFVTTVETLVAEGRLSEERIADAARRILVAKDRLGLLGDRAVPASIGLDVVGCADHRALARTAAAASAVVLTDDGALPIPDGASVLAAGEALDDIGLACGGWTISWAGSAGPITDGCTVLAGLRARLGSERVVYEPSAAFGDATADVGVVSVHESPYVEGGGDRADLSVPADQIQIVERVRAAVDVLIVLVVSGRPLLIDDFVERADAVVACWLPGSEAAGIADVLTGHVAATGRLPVAWPRDTTQISAGHGSPEAPAAWPLGHRAGSSPASTTTTGGT